ncbi:hypothetical protein BT63DRAFT_105445 [Microthyrium microscopicum]|uniref:Uncharacterized protein n=1 Tax=Microthyrium microscopicum TaxID=703497 RepID=A0A6A6U047_9PEZI|nr:hypothetical protein BT63DRAFT_105445 [Microthyrium microscopicum]
MVQLRLIWLIWLASLFFSSPSFAVKRTKFQHWFPEYEQRWTKAVNGPCQQKVTNYILNDRTNCSAPCACAADCILQNTTASMQSQFALAQVLLGLVPVILAFIGPTIAEVAVLSTYRPVLAILLGIGSPAVNILRAVKNVDVREPLEGSQSAISQAWSKWLANQTVAAQLCMKTVTYLLALGAVYNNIRTSIYTDLRIISGWRCGAVYMPLAWSMLAVIVHGWGMIAIRVRLGTLSLPSLKSAMQSDAFKLISTTEDNSISEALFWVASVCAVVHMTYGVLVLSSLIFIGALEALQVLVLYAVSAVVCQFILLSEIATMKNDLLENPVTSGTTGQTRVPKTSQTSPRDAFRNELIRPHSL